MVLAAIVIPARTKKGETIMRFLMKVSMHNEAANAAVSDGSLNKTMQSILSELKPEAAYFLAENGRRTGYLFVNLQDASQIPSIAEPWFLAFNASVDLVPVMVAEDLAKAAPAFEAMAKKYSVKAASAS
jgi:hypothetical protein